MFYLNLKKINLFFIVIIYIYIKLPQDIKWHFIGHLQTNKCKTVCQIPNLYMIETIGKYFNKENKNQTKAKKKKNKIKTKIKKEKEKKEKYI